MAGFRILCYFVLCSQFVFSQINQQNSEQQNFNSQSQDLIRANGNDAYQAPMFRSYGAYSPNTTATTNITDSLLAIQIQLKSYSNPSLQLPGGLSCVCPPTGCPALTDSNNAKCVFSFTVLVPSSGDIVQYVSSDFTPLSITGSLDTSAMNPQQTSFWNSQHEFKLKSKPYAINVFVHHMGRVIRPQDGSLEKDYSVVHVDSFSQSLSDVIPSVAGSSQPREVQLTGSILGTRLTLTYSVQCIGGLQGPNCDLSCNASEANSAVAVCRSNTTGYFYICSYSGSNQVRNCQSCPWGIAKNSYCQDANGGVLDPSTAQVVPTSFRTATIVLGVLAGILFILLIIVTVYSCVLVNRRIHEEDAPGHNYRSSLRAEGNANRPLLQATYTAQPQSPQSDQSQRPPTAAPRSVPSLDAVPAKSSLRKTNIIPPAHLGGGSSLNDSLNSSFASSVPMPPSREADV